MATAASLRSGAVIRLDNAFHKVVESVVHQGGGKSGSMVHTKLRDLSTGHVTERRFATDDKVEDIPLTRLKMQYLYKEGELYTLMNPETYDQVPVSGHAIGPAAAFLKENDVVEVEFYEEKPLSVLYPPTVDLKVASTGAGIRGQTDSTLKEAELENGLKVLVPQFVKEGDHVRVDVETGKYLERVMDREEKGQKFTVSAPAKKASPKPEAPKAPAKIPDEPPH